MIITAVAVETRGDVEPLAELGEEMLRRGHEFRILTSEAFRPFIENKGVTFIKLDTDANHVMKYHEGSDTWRWKRHECGERKYDKDRPD